MMVFTGFWQTRILSVVLVVSAVASWSGSALAIDPPRAQDSVKIEPYKGPPIFLDEPEKIGVAPTIVTRETIKEKLGDGRVEREVAHYSDNSFAADGSYKEFHPNGKVLDKQIFSYSKSLAWPLKRRAGDRVRTDDNDVGNVVLYQLSYTRKQGHPGKLG